MPFQIDWSTVAPSHPVCEDLVEVPTIRAQVRGLGYPYLPAEFDGQKEVVLQWFGDNDSGELTSRNLQFAFPLQADPSSVQWMGHPEWFRIVMLGTLKNWPKPEAIASFERAGLTVDSPVVYLMTSKIGLSDGKGGIVPAARLAPVIYLGDPMFGVIKPRKYASWAVSDEEIAACRKTKRS